MTASSGDLGETPQNEGVDPVFPAYGTPPGPAYGAPAGPAYGAPPPPGYAPPPPPPYGAPYGVPYPGPDPGYSGYPGYPGYPGYLAPPQATTNTLSIVALVSSVVGLLCGIGSILGIVLGAVAIGQIKKSGQRGHGLAVAAIVVGIASLVLSIMMWSYVRHMR